MFQLEVRSLEHRFYVAKIRFLGHNFMFQFSASPR